MKNEETNESKKVFLIFCIRGDLDLIKNYIDKKIVDVNFIKDNDGNSPLHLAAMHNNQEVFKELINAGAKTDIRNNKGELAIDIALLKCCEENNKELVLDLIGIGADVNFKDSNGNTPLHYAAQKGAINVFKELFKAKELIITRNNKGEPPRLDKLLLSAYKEYKFECVDLLIKMGASLDSLDPKNKDVKFTKFLINKINESPELSPRTLSAMRLNIHNRIQGNQTKEH